MARPRKNVESGEIEMLPVKLVRNYRPIGEFLVFDNEHEEGRVPHDGERKKMWAGATVLMAADEARDVVRKGIGERADDF